MSLIHEALKRAEVDKLRRSPYFNNLTVIPPAEDEVPPPPRPRPQPAEPAPLASTGVPTLKILVLGMLLAAGIGGLSVWKQYSGRGAVPATASAQDAARPLGLTTALATAPQPPSAGPTPSSPATPAETRAKPPAQATPPAAKTTPPAAQVTPPAAPAQPAPGPAAASIEDVPPPSEPAAAATASSPGPAPDQTVAAVPPAQTTNTTSAASPTGRTAAAKPKAGSATAAGPSRSPASKVAAARPDTARYRLSAIGHGTEGSHALINERVVQEGQTILEAKVVKIGPTYVELEADGTRFTIRL